MTRSHLRWPTFVYALVAASMSGCMHAAPVPEWVYICQDVQDVTPCPPEDVGHGTDEVGPRP